MSPANHKDRNQEDGFVPMRAQNKIVWQDAAGTERGRDGEVLGKERTEGITAEYQNE